MDEEWNSPPQASEASFSTTHDSLLSGVSLSGYDDDGHIASFYVASGVSNGTLTFHSDGTFEWMPPPLWVGQTSFVFGVIDNEGATDEAIVTLTAGNGWTSAGADDFSLNFPDNSEESVTIELPVLNNDNDEDSDALTIISVTASHAGAQVAIDPTGHYILYTPPQLGSSDNITLDATGSGQSEEVQADPVHVGVRMSFSDYFTYTIADVVGQIETARVTVQASGEPAWSARSKYHTAGANEIDGTPGCDSQLLIKYGKDTAGIIFGPNEQMWQTNRSQLTAVEWTAGQVVDHSRPDFVIDVKDIADNATTHTTEDTLRYQPTWANDMFVKWDVDRKVGLNCVDYKLLVDGGSADVSEGTLSQYEEDMRDLWDIPDVHYVYVNKQFVMDALAAGAISGAQFDYIVDAVEGCNTCWDDVTTKFEYLDNGAEAFVYVN